MRKLILILFIVSLPFAKERLFSENELINNNTLLCIFHVDSVSQTTNDSLSFKILSCTKKEDIIGKTPNNFQIISGGIENSIFDVGKTYLAYLIYYDNNKYYKAVGEYNRFAKEINPDSTIMWRKSIKSTKNAEAKFKVNEIIQRAKKQFNKKKP
jgi:hypothetical protein